MGIHKNSMLVRKIMRSLFLLLRKWKPWDNLEGHDTTVSEMLNQLSNGHKCLGIKNNGKIVGFTWCRFDVFDYPPSKGFPLMKDEAYLYDMYILKDCRGSNLAPLLRYSLYQELAIIGRTVLYSFSIITNKPAIRFKKKLEAKIVTLRLYIKLGKQSAGTGSSKHINKVSVKRTSLNK